MKSKLLASFIFTKTKAKQNKTRGKTLNIAICLYPNVNFIKMDFFYYYKKYNFYEDHYINNSIIRLENSKCRTFFSLFRRIREKKELEKRGKIS